MMGTGWDDEDEDGDGSDEKGETGGDGGGVGQAATAVHNSSGGVMAQGGVEGASGGGV